MDSNTSQWQADSALLRCFEPFEIIDERLSSGNLGFDRQKAFTLIQEVVMLWNAWSMQPLQIPPKSHAIVTSLIAQLDYGPTNDSNNEQIIYLTAQKHPSGRHTLMKRIGERSGDTDYPPGSRLFGNLDEDDFLRAVLQEIKRLEDLGKEVVFHNQTQD